MTPTGTHIKCHNCKEFILYDANTCQYCKKVVKNNTANADQFDHITFIKNELKEQYEIYDIIGKGGMASVYKAKQINLDRTVALKIIHHNMVHDQEFLDRFLEEAKISAQLSHPNIVNIYDFGKVGDIYYISMQYLDGKDLAKIIRERKTLPAAEAIQYANKIAHALHYIHKKGYLHRDIKSSNIFITSDNEPVITDFGIAYHAGSTAKTIAGTLLGTPEYLSPEQAAGKMATSASDYYSLGIVLYECLTGQLPFTDDNPAVTINKIISASPYKPTSVNPTIPKKAEEITLGLMSKNAHKRNIYIKRLLDNEETLTSKPIKRRIPKDPNTIRMAAIAILSLLLTIILAAIIYLSVFQAEMTTESSLEQTSLPPPTDSRDQSQPKPIDKNSNAKTVDLPDVVKIIENNMLRFDGFSIMSTQVSDEIWNIVRDNDGSIESARNLISGGGNYINNASYGEIQKFFSKLNNLQNNPYHYDLPSYNELVKTNRHSSYVQLTNEVSGRQVLYINPKRSYGIENYIGRNQKPKRIGGGLEITFGIVRRHN